MGNNNQSDSEFEELLRPKKKFKVYKSNKLLQLSLHDAATKNDVQKLIYLLDICKSQGVDIDLNKKYDENKTLLHEAAIKNEKQSYFELIKILLNNGSDVNARDVNGETPLWCLLQNQASVDMLKLFLRFKPDLTNGDDHDSCILSSAVNSGNNLEVVKFLVEDMGLDVNHRNKYGATPLQWATLYNLGDSHYEILEYLLNVGADVSSRNSDGWTPFCCVVTRANWKVIELFLKHNADVHTVSYYDRNVLFAFYDKNSDVQVLQKMINDFNLNVDHADNGNKTPLHHIIRSNSVEYPINIKVIKCLLKNGAYFNTPNKDGLTPLISAANYIHEDEDDWFLENMNLFNFLIDQTDFSVVYEGVHIFEYYYENEYVAENGDHRPHSKYLWKWILEHLAKLKFLKIPIHPLVPEFIEKI